MTKRICVPGQGTLMGPKGTVILVAEDQEASEIMTPTLLKSVQRLPGPEFKGICHVSDLM